MGPQGRTHTPIRRRSIRTLVGGYLSGQAFVGTMDGIGVEMYGELDTMSRRLEPIMTKLAKACLSSKPDDIDQFCYKFFANRLGIDPSARAELSEGGQRDSRKAAYGASGRPNPAATDDDLDDHEAEEESDFTAALIRAKSRKNITRREPSDIDEDFSHGQTRGGGNAPVALDDDLDDDEAEEESDFTAAVIRSKSRKIIVRKKNYESSDDDGDNGNSLGSDVTTPGAGAGASLSPRDLDLADDDDSDYDEQCKVMPGRVKSMNMGTETQAHEEDLRIVSPEEQARLTALALEAQSDPRMKVLFETWDADSSGSVDLMELVIALHKFNRVMEDGSGLARASDALIGSDVNMDDGSGQEANGHELNMDDFTKFIVKFCDDAYGKPFSEMAAHMLSVAKSTSERAAMAAAEGGDASQIMADDEAEVEVLKEAIRGVEESVVDNIEKIKERRRVMFK